MESNIIAPQSSLIRVDSLLSPPSSLQGKKHAITLSELCDDVLLIVCSYLEQTREPLETPLKNLSIVNSRLSQVLLPHILKILRINAPLKLLRKTQAPLKHHHAHTLKIDMFGSLWWWCSGLYVNSSDAIDLFAFIHTLPNLTTLSISMLSRSLDLFESAFTAPNPPTPTFFLLPTIKSLTLTPSASFLAAHCPDLLHLTIRDNNEQCTIEPSSSLSSRLLPSTPTFPSATLPSKTLTHLSTTAAWSTPELNFLVSNFPNLTHLNMQSEQYTYRASIPCIMVILSRLKGLRVLRLNRIHKLDVGYRAVWKRVVQECRTEGERMELWRGDERRRVGAENEVVGCAMRCCGRLREVWVGGERVARRIVGGEEEGEGVKWVWERRREDVDGEGVSALWAKYRVERQGVVVAWEVGM